MLNNQSTTSFIHADLAQTTSQEGGGAFMCENRSMFEAYIFKHSTSIHSYDSFFIGLHLLFTQVGVPSHVASP